MLEREVKGERERGRDRGSLVASVNNKCVSVCMCICERERDRRNCRFARSQFSSTQRCVVRQWAISRLVRSPDRVSESHRQSTDSTLETVDCALGARTRTHPRAHASAAREDGLLHSKSGKNRWTEVGLLCSEAGTRRSQVVRRSDQDPAALTVDASRTWYLRAHAHTQCDRE